MEKKYTTPSFEIVSFKAEDIIQTSGSAPQKVKMPKTLDGATSVAPQTIDVFE